MKRFKTKLCVLCGEREERSEAAVVLCSNCVAVLMAQEDEEKIRLYKGLIQKNRTEAAKMVESFTTGRRDGELMAQIKAQGARNSARRLGVSHTAVNSWIKKGKIPKRQVEKLQGGN